ncbi:MAG: DUF4115 domain-containing protein [Xanthomonadales bacterium]|nr:DUF4115 domain-containing protein [Xanthomonadales bacterium]
MSLPDQLKAAREAKNWTIEDVGQQLRLPAKLIKQIEGGDYQSLGAPIYQRGYLHSFARLVGVPAAQVDEALADSVQVEPELVATGVVPRGALVAERYLRSATYIALTALIAAPVVWYAASGRLSEELASFDMRQRTVDETTLPIPQASRQGNGSDVVRASMFPEVTVSRPEPLIAEDLVAADGQLSDAADSAGSRSADAVEEAAGPEQIVGSGAHLAELELVGESWVEVVGVDGTAIQRAVLGPGHWQFRSDSGMSLTIGNSLEATLRADGQKVDLSANRSPNNVARIELFAGEG